MDVVKPNTPNNFFLPKPWSTDLDGVIPNVVFTLQVHFSCSYLPLICLSTYQNIQLLIRIQWTTENGILISSTRWPIYNKLFPGQNSFVFCQKNIVLGRPGFIKSINDFVIFTRFNLCILLKGDI